MFVTVPQCNCTVKAGLLEAKKNTFNPCSLDVNSLFKMDTKTDTS